MEEIVNTREPILLLHGEQSSTSISLSSYDTLKQARASINQTKGMSLGSFRHRLLAR